MSHTRGLPIGSDGSSYFALCGAAVVGGGGV